MVKIMVHQHLQDILVKLIVVNVLANKLPFIQRIWIWDENSVQICVFQLEINETFCDFQTLCYKIASKTLLVIVMMFWSSSWDLDLIWSSSMLIGQHWIFCSSMSQINLRYWVTILLRSGSLLFRRIINLKSVADHGHSDVDVADTQGHCIPGGNEPNLISVLWC